MPLKMIQNDITKVRADAIVNAANETLLGGGGVDGAIHKAAGPELLEECRGLGGCQVGQAKITKGYRLPAKHVIHTVGPVWQGGHKGEKELLKACYRNSLDIAREYSLESVAFPLISAGAFGYPKDQALQVAVAAIGDFLLQHDMEVILVVYDKATVALSEKHHDAIKQYVDDRYVEAHLVSITISRRDIPRRLELLAAEETKLDYKINHLQEAPGEELLSQHILEELVIRIEETFSQMLLRKIDEKGLVDTEAYKKANVDRKLFSKIRNDIHYKPSKRTVLAFAIALELSLDETNDLLLRAGFALSRSSRADLIVQYFIERENYNMFEINEALFAFDQPTLGI
ncbi:O-acetyl-ADP-ribose deacetylase [Anoxynatronum buryatiense]|uniref:O-acetyl-ADP-ribose deacetylase (Regulator of RNase III), contains Macro domain n=1 Tax=Anoxynatronum buryatiense TaxID=489973 RepID=A0AA45WYZ3_9CLOT|nr:O-acetyl-ADP-ribose deacetylase [Anoxynatronum buryatiense]SMP70854.1 O-acetyl-ADP-ribose deacetylase (regulator of RNase III), contains Macro domain [Anoxynatronum buryatiense]